MEKSIKDLLLELKPLPKYQFERRIDIFILHELETVFSKIFNEKVYFLYPEFPLRKLSIATDNIYNADYEYIQGLKNVVENHNTNADYLMASENYFYLVELKTDLKSVNDVRQLIYYAHYSTKNFTDLFNFFKNNLAYGLKQDKKWKFGFNFLLENYEKKLGKKIENETDKPIKIVYIGPVGIESVNEKIKPHVFNTINFKQIATIIDDVNLKELLLSI